KGGSPGAGGLTSTPRMRSSPRVRREEIRAPPMKPPAPVTTISSLVSVMPLPLANRALVSVENHPSSIHRVTRNAEADDRSGDRKKAITQVRFQVILAQLHCGRKAAGRLPQLVHLSVSASAVSS